MLISLNPRSLDFTLSSFALAAVPLYCIIRTIYNRHNQLPLPPGPKPWPILGNISDFPLAHEGRFWTAHKELYGPISSIKALGTTFIIVNDLGIALELLEKRSSVYSSRYQATLSGKMIKAGYLSSLLPYGSEWKHHRKLIQGYIGPVSAMGMIESVETIEARRLLLKILEQPTAFVQHLRAFAGAVILRITYGYTIEPEGTDPLVDLAEDAMDRALFPAAQSGVWAVDIFPYLQYLPSWLPGMKFKRTARDWARVWQEFYDKPFAFVQSQMATGKAKPSFTSQYIEKGMAETPKDQMSLKHAATTVFAAGADTTVSAIETFFLAMSLFPDVFRRAQEEVDRVIGNERLPQFTDRVNLPYINALIKELLRWEQVAPTAIPHLCTQEDTYAGYRIPKGSVIIPNSWGISRDPALYKDPCSVMPERFLGDESELDPYLLAFGFGRRLCPGKRLADSSMFITIAMLVAVFNITKAQDEFGRDIGPDHEYKPGIVSHPMPFTCSISPRSEKAVKLIRSVLHDYPFEKGDADVLNVKM